LIEAILKVGDSGRMKGKRRKIPKQKNTRCFRHALPVRGGVECLGWTCRGTANEKKRQGAAKKNNITKKNKKSRSAPK